MLARLPPNLRRIVKAAFAILLCLALVGATYQGVATSLERRELERPGRLVDVGGHQLHIHCQGQGSPTVVLEAAAGGMSAAWSWIQPELASVTRVCSYDRAWLGWSEGGDEGYSSARIPEELHTLLLNAGERGPFVLVGHELGATVVRDFAARFGGETAAVVLVQESGARSRSPFFRAWPWLARVGLLRAAGTLSNLAAELPGESGDAMRIFLNRPRSFDARSARVVECRRGRGREPLPSPRSLDTCHRGDYRQSRSSRISLDARAGRARHSGHPRRNRPSAR